MINVQFLKMPGRVKAVTTKNEDDSYTVFLNSVLNHEQQLEGYKHELKHISDEDFIKEDVDSIEYHAHANING